MDNGQRSKYVKSMLIFPTDKGESAREEHLIFLAKKMINVCKEYIEFSDS